MDSTGEIPDRGKGQERDCESRRGRESSRAWGAWPQFKASSRRSVRAVWLEWHGEEHLCANLCRMHRRQCAHIKKHIFVHVFFLHIDKEQSSPRAVKNPSQQGRYALTLSGWALIS